MSASDNVVKNVRGLMGENGVTQSQLGEWLGVSQAAITKRITSRSVTFDVDELETIARQFGVTIQSLFDPPRTSTMVGVGGAGNPLKIRHFLPTDNPLTVRLTVGCSAELSYAGSSDPMLTPTDFAAIEAYANANHPVG